MNRIRILAVLGALVVPLDWSNPSGSLSQAQAGEARHTTSGDLFYNYYVPPVGAYSVGAAMYPCPRPTPPLVGHTYVTYPPLMPQEFLYPHHRFYSTQHEDGSRTATCVRWWW
jgi:hypothetical protein